LRARHSRRHGNLTLRQRRWSRLYPLLLIVGFTAGVLALNLARGSAASAQHPRKTHTVAITGRRTATLSTSTRHAQAILPTDATSTATADWSCIRRWESSGGVGNGDYTLQTGPEPYGGAYQFNLTTWKALGYSGLPSEASPATQDHAALAEYAWAQRYFGNGWEPWESAGRCGL
jgi:hypothetical protein